MYYVSIDILNLDVNMLLIRIILSKDKDARYVTATIKYMLQFLLWEIAFDLVKVLIDSISLEYSGVLQSFYKRGS